jgi:hypothetical protein
MTVRTITGLNLLQAVLENERRREELKKELRQLKYNDTIGKPSLFYEV